MPAFNTITVTRDGQIATVTIQSKDRKALTGPHVEIGAAISPSCATTTACASSIITGTDDAFFLPPKGSPKASRPHARPRLGPHAGHAPHLSEHHRDREAGDRQGQRQRHRLRLEPRVRLRPHRREPRTRSSATTISAMGKSIQGGRTDFGTVPGDGGTVFVPLHMSPCLAKEYLWLAQRDDRQGAGGGAHHQCRGAGARSSTPRSTPWRRRCSSARPTRWRSPSAPPTRAYAERFNLTYDLAWSYELLNFFQHGQHVDERGVSTL